MLRILFCFVAITAYGSELLDKFAEPNLEKIYEYYAHLGPQDCDIGEHMHVLRRLAAECPHIVEIGIANVISTWGILQGLADNPAEERSYLGIDIKWPPLDNLQFAQEEAEKRGISFEFRLGNDLHLDIEPADFLFIDSMHTYCHLSYELETFSPKIRKYIAMHDTSEPWGHREDGEYQGDYSEYPAHYPRYRRGLWPAVVDFLRTHPEWVLEERRLNCHGFTILRRVK